MNCFELICLSMVAILCQCASNETMAIRGRGTRHHGAAMVMKELLAARQKGKIETVSACIQTRSLFCSGLRCCALLLRAACIQTRSPFCSGLRCIALAPPPTAARARLLCKKWRKWRGTLFTWLPDAYVSIALLQVAGGFTLVYLPSVKEFYFASDVTMLPRETPVGTVLIAVYTEDEREHFRVPRVLIHDVLAWGDTFETSRTPLDQRAAVTRYKLLRERLLPLIVNQRYLVLQWCGFLTAAKQFLSGELAVGHRVGGLVAILDGAAGAPCALSQEVAQHMQQGAS